MMRVHAVGNHAVVVGRRLVQGGMLPGLGPQGTVHGHGRGVCPPSYPPSSPCTAPALPQDIFTEYIPGFQNQIPTSQRNQTLLAFVRAAADAVHCSSRARRDMGFDPASQAACEALPAPESQVAAFECMAGACAFVKRVGKE